MHGVEKTGSNNDWFSVEELEAARAAYLEEQQQDNPSPHVKLRYALTLVKSKKREDKKRGLGLLDDLLAVGFESEQCLYWIALTTYGLDDYRTSRHHCERLLKINPTHLQALALHQCIKNHRSYADGLMSVGLIGAAVVAGIAFKMFLRR